jgi:hypothetical protein
MLDASSTGVKILYIYIYIALQVLNSDTMWVTASYSGLQVLLFSWILHAISNSQVFSKQLPIDQGASLKYNIILLHVPLE